MLFGILPLQVGGMKHRNAKIQLPSGGVERVTATAFKLLLCYAMLTGRTFSTGTHVLNTILVTGTDLNCVHAGFWTAT